MKKLQALETYQQLMADSTTGPIDKQLQRRAGDTPAEVSGKIAADKDEIDLLAAAVLIAQVCHQLSAWNTDRKNEQQQRTSLFVP